MNNTINPIEHLRKQYSIICKWLDDGKLRAHPKEIFLFQLLNQELELYLIDEEKKGKRIKK